MRKTELKRVTGIVIFTLLTLAMVMSILGIVIAPIGGA